MNRIRITVTLLAFLAALAVRGAQVTIHGKITDSNSEPVEFVTVKIAGTAIGTQSNLQGDFRLSAPAADTLRIVFTCIGYREEARTLVKPKGDITMNMRMTPDKVLGEVNVEAIKAQTSTMQTVDASVTRRAPDASGGQVESVITTLAGVSASNELSSQYSVRGGSYDENSVYINGIEVYRPQLITSGQQEGLSIINPDMVGSVNFSTGGFPAKYADKMSSVLDITYRQPEALEGSISGSLMGASASFGQSSGKFSQLYGVRYKANNSLLSSLEDKGEYDPKYFDFQTSINYSPSEKFRIGFLGNIALNDYKFTPQNRETKFGTSAVAKTFQVYFDGQEKDKFETWFGALTATWNPSKATSLSLLASGFLSNELVTYDIAGEYWIKDTGSDSPDTAVGAEEGVGRYMEHARNRLRSTVFSLGLQGSSRIGAKNTLEYGLTYRHEKVMERSREWEKRDSAGYSLPSSGDLVRVIYNLNSHQDLASDRISAYIQDTWRHNASFGYLSVNAGVRLSYWTFNKEFLASPRINVGFVPDAAPKWTFRFATGLYYQSPFYKEMRLASTDALGNRNIVLNSDIKSQASYQVILGSDFTFRMVNRPFRFSTEIYYKHLSNLIPYTLDNLRIVYEGRNTSTGHIAGIDMRLFGQFVPGSDSWLSVSLLNARENLNGVSVPRPNERRYNIALFFTDYFPKLPKLKFSLKGILSDGLPLTAPGQTRDQGYFRTPAYKRVDIGLSYGIITPRPEGVPRTGIHKWIKSLWVGVDCFNLLDISNVSSYYWVTDVNDCAYAVPNYLTRRQFNIRFTLDF